MRLVLYLTAIVMAVCAATEAIRHHAASACLLAVGSLLVVHALQQSRRRK